MVSLLVTVKRLFRSIDDRERECSVNVFPVTGCTIPPLEPFSQAAKLHPQTVQRTFLDHCAWTDPLAPHLALLPLHPHVDLRRSRISHHGVTVGKTCLQILPKIRTPVGHVSAPTAAVEILRFHEASWENVVDKREILLRVSCREVKCRVVRSCARAICLMCRGVFRIRVLLLLLVLLRWCPAKSVFLQLGESTCVHTARVACQRPLSVSHFLHFTKKKKENILITCSFYPFFFKLFSVPLHIYTQIQCILLISVIIHFRFMYLILASSVASTVSTVQHIAAFWDTAVTQTEHGRRKNTLRQRSTRRRARVLRNCSVSEQLQQCVGAPHRYGGGSSYFACSEEAKRSVAFFSSSNLLAPQRLPCATWQGARVHVRAFCRWSVFIMDESGVTDCK